MKGQIFHLPDAVLGIQMNALGRAVHNQLGTSKKIYGVSWDGGSNSVLPRTDDAVGMVANVGVDTQVVRGRIKQEEVKAK